MDRRTFLKRTAVVVMGIRALDGQVVQEAFVDVVKYDDLLVHIKLHSMNTQLSEVLKDVYVDVISSHFNQHSVLLSGRVESINGRDITIYRV